MIMLYVTCQGQCAPFSPHVCGGSWLEDSCPKLVNLLLCFGRLFERLNSGKNTRVPSREQSRYLLNNL